ncbi:uncharacterized protein LOC131681069 [Topomyia yanbarensis]|uniref:uncharacterized protein LOC131681069 n=1 Tax=Topomyia yanbarensis TaxID=2498891 RepID=UPI00273C7FC4|nr:uncharacterized protein LOC131681069 [Topomyia yanbarensis]
MVNDKRCYILVYVDDLIIASEEEEIITLISKTLARNFEIVSLGEVRNYVGIEVERDSFGDFHISQQKYIADIIMSAGLYDSKSSKIPIDVGYFKQDTEAKPLADNSNINAEAEFVALSEASQEAIWLQRLLRDLGEDVHTVQLYEDNQSCLKMIQSEKFSNRTKHIDTKYNFVKDLNTTGAIKYVYCPSEQMVADLLTKPVARIRVEQLRRLSGLEN